MTRIQEERKHMTVEGETEQRRYKPRNAIKPQKLEDTSGSPQSLQRAWPCLTPCPEIPVKLVLDCHPGPVKQ